MRPAALETRQVTKRFGTHTALAEVSLTVAAGECVALIGQSGAGKTTLLRLFNRLVAPDTGQVAIGGQDANELDPIALRRRTGYVQQHGGLLPHWTVAQNVGLVPRLLGQERRAIEARVDQLLELVGLGAQPFRQRYPRELSGGERQRVAIARALAADPPVVLLDEPFGALDAITRSELRQEFIDIRRQLQKTIVMVTHDLDDALTLADRVAVMRAGTIVESGTPAALCAPPGHPYVQALLERARHPWLAGET